jgi:predicted DNA-binding protein
LPKGNCKDGQLRIGGRCRNKDDVTVQELADEYYKNFEKKKRDNGEEFWVKKDGAPEELGELVREAHGDMFPDDYKYEFIEEALARISETEDENSLESPELEPDVYTHDRLKWLSSNLGRPYYVDEAIKDFGKADTIIDDIGMGQLKEKEEVYFAVLQGLKKILED